MKKIIILFSLVFFIVVQSCETIDGKKYSEEEKYGSILITCNVDSGQIFLKTGEKGKYENTEKYTSTKDTVHLDSVPVGAHYIKVQLARYQTAEHNVKVEKNKESNISVQLQLLTSFSDLLVITNPDSAVIIVDDLPQGLSPLMLKSLAPGNHIIKIYKGSHRPVNLPMTLIGGAVDTIEQDLSVSRTVLIEHFSNTHCTPCVAVDHALEEVLKNTGPDTVASIGIHTNIPGPSDPMYLAAKTDNNARMQYYELRTNPFLIFEGIYSQNHASGLETLINSYYNVPPDAILEIFNFKINQNVLSGKVRIEALTNLHDITMQIAIIEKEINYTNPPGSNLETHFFDVLRKLWPSASGTSITLSSGNIQFIDFETTIDSEWHVDQLEVIAFLQNPATKDVLQTVWTMYP